MPNYHHSHGQCDRDKANADVGSRELRNVIPIRKARSCSTGVMGQGPDWSVARSTLASGVVQIMARKRRSVPRPGKWSWKRRERDQTFFLCMCKLLSSSFGSDKSSALPKTCLQAFSIRSNSGRATCQAHPCTLFRQNEVASHRPTLTSFWSRILPEAAREEHSIWLHHPVTRANSETSEE